MKKIFLFSLAVSLLLFGAASLPWNGTSAETNDQIELGEGKLEKISSPEMIKFYEKIKKVGTVLYGYKKTVENQNKYIYPSENCKSQCGDGICQEVVAMVIGGACAESVKSCPADCKNSSTEPAALEKIPSPKEIILYEKIRKVGTALWGIRKNTDAPIVTAAIAPCVIAAIEIKDKAVMENNTGTTAKLNEAIASRSACQKTALLAAVDKQKQTMGECVKIFKDTHKGVKADSQKTHKTIWQTYRDGLKACSKTAANSTAAAISSLEINVEDGGGSIVEASE